MVGQFAHIIQSEADTDSQWRSKMAAVDVERGKVSVKYLN
jgi:hypothetical protein